eukprot:4811450-Amphidinium_carterae.1
MPLQVSLMTFLHFCFFQSAVRFHDRHVTQTHLLRKGEGHHGGMRVYSSWILLCVLASVQAQDTSTLNGRSRAHSLNRCCMFRTEVLASGPGAMYSVAKAVPGFLHVSDLWRWLINNAVALFSGLPC